MRPDTLRRVSEAIDIVGNPEHPAWNRIVDHIELKIREPSDSELAAALRRVRALWPVDADALDAALLEDPPLVVLGQGTSKRVCTGDDFGGTGFFPLRKASLRSKRAALSLLYKILSFFGVRR